MHGSRTVLVRTHDCMQGNAIGEGGARNFARVLELNTCITHLNISVCWRSSGGWMYGSRMALMSTHDCMQYNGIGEVGARNLARALEHNTCITHLDVSVRWGRDGGRNTWW